jgi:hypothetical protein
MFYFTTFFTNNIFTYLNVLHAFLDLSSLSSSCCYMLCTIYIFSPRHDMADHCTDIFTMDTDDTNRKISNTTNFLIICRYLNLVKNERISCYNIKTDYSEQYVIFSLDFAWKGTLLSALKGNNSCKTYNSWLKICSFWTFYFLTDKDSAVPTWRYFPPKSSLSPRLQCFWTVSLFITVYWWDQKHYSWLASLLDIKNTAEYVRNESS